VQELIEKSPALVSVQRDAREGMLDDAESALYRAVIQGEAWAVCFLLKTQGKGRGYIERQELDHRGSVSATFDLSAATDADLDRAIAAAQPLLAAGLLPLAGS
jgi:hypothetical protein